MLFLLLYPKNVDRKLGKSFDIFCVFLLGSHEKCTRNTNLSRVAHAKTVIIITIYTISFRKEKITVR